jgi:hypothetical protein
MRRTISEWLTCELLESKLAVSTVAKILTAELRPEFRFENSHRRAFRFGTTRGFVHYAEGASAVRSVAVSASVSAH